MYSTPPLKRKIKNHMDSNRYSFLKFWKVEKDKLNNFFLEFRCLVSVRLVKNVRIGQKEEEKCASKRVTKLIQRKTNHNFNIYCYSIYRFKIQWKEFENTIKSLPIFLQTEINTIYSCSIKTYLSRSKQQKVRN